MFKKLRDKISEEVQHTSLRLPTSVQQITQQFTGPGTVDPGGVSTEHPSFDVASAASLQDELLVDISGIQPAGDNKDLFSIDEESLEGSPIKSNCNNMTNPSTLDVIDLQSDEDRRSNHPQLHQPLVAASMSRLDSERAASGDGTIASTVEGLTFDPSSPSPSTPLSPISPSHPGDQGGVGVAAGGGGYSRTAGSRGFGGRPRRDSMDSNVSEVSTTSGLFRINEVPGVGFTIPQSDLESASEWEEGSMTGGITDKITKDVLYQAYVKMRQRYHKYKGRYADVVRAYREKERETEKLRDVLAKTQDKAVRRVSELREQCALETQAKAHLEEELRSDLEEKDHMIAALQTKVRLLQEGYGSVAIVQNANARNGNNNNNNSDNSISKSCVSLDSGLAGPAWEDTTTLASEGAASTPLASTIIKASELEHDSNNSYKDGRAGSVAPISSAVKDDSDTANIINNNSSNTSISGRERSLLDAGEAGGAGEGGAASDGDNVSVVSLGSVSTHTAVSVAASVVSSYSQLQADELIDKLKGEVSQHKQLLARCMENIRSNKDKLAALTMQRDSLAAQLTAKTDQMAAITTQHGEELEELRHAMESSSLSMAETKQHLFQELQRKEEEVERLTEENRELTSTVQKLEVATTTQSLGSAGQDPSSQPQSLGATEVEDEAASLEREAIRLAAQLCLDRQEAPPDQSAAGEQQTPPSVESRLQEVLAINEALAEDMETIRTERKRLDIRIDDLGEKNRQSEELVSQLTDDCAEMEAKLTSMEKKNEKLKAELDNLNGSYNELQGIVQGHVSQKNELIKTIKEQEATLKLARADELSLEERCEELVVEKKELETRLQETVSEKDDLVLQLNSLGKEKALVTQRLVEMEEMKTMLDKQLMTSLMNEKTLSKNIVELKTLNEENTQNAFEADRKIRELSAQIEDISVMRRKENASHQELLTKWEAASSDLAFFKENYAKLEKDLSNSKTRCEELESQYMSLIQAHSEASQSTLSFEEQVKELQKINAELNSSSRTLQSDNKQLLANLEKIQEEKADIEKDRGEVEKELQELMTSRTLMEEELTSLKDRSAALLKEKEDLAKEIKHISLLRETAEKERDEFRDKFYNEKEAKDERYHRVVELEEQMKIIKQKEDTLNNLNNQLEQRVRQLEGDLQKNEEGCKEGEAAVKEWKDKWRILKEDNKRLKENSGTVDRLHEEISLLNTRSGQLGQEIDSLKCTLTSKDEEIVQKQEQIGLKNNEICTLKQMLSEITEDITKVKKDLSDQQSNKLDELEKCGQTIQDLNSRLWALLEEMDRQKNTMAEIEDRARASQLNCDELSAEVQKLSALIQEKDDLLTALQSEMETVLNSQTQSVKEMETKLANNGDSLLKLQDLLSTRETQFREVTAEKLDLDNHLRELSEAKNRLDDEFRELTDCKTRLSDELRERKEAGEAQSRELLVLNEQLNEMKEEVKSYQDELEVSKSEVVGAGNDCLILEEKVKNLMKVLEDREEEVERVQETNAEMGDEVERMKRECAESLNEEHQKSERLELSGRELEARVQEKVRELAVCQEQLDHLNQRLEAITKENQSRVLECTNQVEETNKALLEKEAMLDRVQSEFSRLANSLTEHEAHALNQSEECQRLHALVSDKDAKIQELLQEKQEFLSSYDSKVGELDDLLNKEKLFLKTTQESYEERVSSLEEDLTRSEELYKNQVANIVQDKQALSKRLSDQENEFCQQEKTLLQQVATLVERVKTIEEAQLSSIQQSSDGDPHDSPDGGPFEVTAIRNVQQGLSAVAPLSSAASDLVAENARLRASIARLERDRTETAKLVATLQFNNEHNRAKLEESSEVKIMEDAYTDMTKQLAANKIELDERDKSVVEQQLLEKMKELDSRLTKEKEEIATQMRQQKSEYEERSFTERGQLQQKYEDEVKSLRDEVRGLEDVRRRYAKQIEQIETNNCEMHSKMAAIQDARDRDARDRDHLANDLGQLQALKLSLDQQIVALSEEKTSLETRLREEAERVSKLSEKTSQLQQAEEHLRKLLAEITASREQLISDVSSLTASRDDTAERLEEQRAQCEVLRQELAQAKERLEVLWAVEDELKRDVERLNKESEERPDTAADIKAKDDRINALENELKRAAEDIARRTAEARASADHQHQQQLKSLAAEYDARLAEAAAAAAESGGEVSGVRAALLSSQEEAREKADALDSLQHTRAHETSLSELMSEQSSSERAVRGEAEALVRSVEAAWRSRADKLLQQREQQLREEMDGLQQEWNKERKELERLTGVAAAAFRSGTDSVELLRTQVQQQREELQHIKRQHQLEVSELRALLDVKQRRRREGGTGVRLGGTLEDAAEFEYLKNVLYQYMMGKETQTLAKVLCAVVKFDQQQQQEIVAFQQALSATLEATSTEAVAGPATTVPTGASVGSSGYC